MPRSLQPDRQLFGVTLALCFIGAVMVFSASAVTAGQQTGNGYTFLLRQLLWIAIGIAGMFWLMNTDYRKLRQPRVIFTGLSVTLLLLIAVFFLDRSHATHRWIRLGPASFQPSELAKLVVIFYLAWFLEIRRKPRGFGVNDPLHTLLPALGTVLVMVALVLAEPDMGTACMIFMIAFVMLYVSGLSWRYMFATGLAAIPAIYLLIVRVPYRLRTRQIIFFAGCRPAGPRLPIAAVAHCGRLGRVFRRGTDGKPPKTFLSARSTHGFYFRGDLRGSWVHRRGGSARAVCHVRLARIRNRDEGAG